MNKVKFKDVAHLYLGAKCRHRYVDYLPETWTIWTSLTISGLRIFQDASVDGIQVQLRKLESISQEEADYLAWLCMDSEKNLDSDSRVSPDEVDVYEIAPNDDATMVDGDVAVVLCLSCRCFFGQLVVYPNGDLKLTDEEGEAQPPIERTAMIITWMLSKHFDLFNLIENGEAIDAATTTPQTVKP